MRTEPNDEPAVTAAGGRITSRGVRIWAAPGELEELRLQFHARASLLLRGFMAPELVDRLRTRVESAGFERRVIPGAGDLSFSADGIAFAMAHLLMNRPEVFRYMEHLTGDRPIRGFEGKVRRYGRDAGDTLGWHNDLNDRTRLLAMSFQLGSEEYRGGRLQVREKDSPVLLAEYGCASPGDAVIFRIHPSVEHQVTPVQDGLRTTFVGWFVSREVPVLGADHIPQPL